MLKRTLNVLAVVFLLQLAVLAQISGGGNVSVSGAVIAGHCTSFLNSTTIMDAGGICGGTGSSPGGSVGAIQWNNTTFAGTTLTDLSYGGHTLTLGSTGIFDTSQASVTAGVVLPKGAGAAPTTDAVIAFNNTNHLPVFGSNGSTLTWPSTLAAVSHDFLTSYTNTTGVFTQAQPAFTDISGTATATQGGTGQNSSAATGAAIVTSGTWSFPASLTVPFGGSGAATFTAHGVLLGETASPFGVTAVGATNTVLNGNTGADPTFGTVPNAALANSSITLNGTANQITSPGSTALGGTAVYALASPLIVPGKATFHSGGTAAASINVPTSAAPTSPASGDLWNLSGILQFYDGTNTNNEVTTQGAVTSGNIPAYSGTGGLLGTGYPPQGTDTNLITSGTISGAAGTAVCLDAQSGLTTTSCGGGTVTVSGSPTNGLLTAWTSGTNITGVAQWTNSASGTIISGSSTSILNTSGNIDFSSATHTLSFQANTFANIPATCTLGELYFATDATQGQSIYECYVGNTWVQQLNSGASGMNQQASNATGTTAVPVNWLPGPDNSVDLGSLTKRWRNEYKSGSDIWTNVSSVADTGLCRGAAGQLDVSNGGACAATGNLFAAGFASGSATVPGTGEISLPASAAPGFPASGGLVWFDSTDLRTHDIGNANTVGTMVVALPNASHKWLNSLGTNGVLTQTQPAATDLAAQAANTVVMNATGGSASPTAVPLPTCTGSGSADIYDTSSHTWVCNTITGGGGLPTATAQGQLPSATGAGTSYAAQTKQLTDTRDDPAAGANLCIRLNDQNGIAGTNLTGSNVQIVTTFGERSASKNECGATDIAAFANENLINGSTNFHTDTGLHIESWQQIIGENADVVGVRATSNLSGSVIQATSSFPSTSNITLTATHNNGFVNIIAGAGEGLPLISPGTRLRIDYPTTATYTSASGTITVTAVSPSTWVQAGGAGYSGVNSITVSNCSVPAGISVTGFTGGSGTLAFTNSGTSGFVVNEIINLSGFTAPNLNLNGQQVTITVTNGTSTFSAAVTGSGYSSGSGTATSLAPNGTFTATGGGAGGATMTYANLSSGSGSSCYVVVTNGDNNGAPGNMYTVTKCIGTGGACANADITTGGNSFNSQMYTLAGSSNINVNVTPAIASTGTITGESFSIFQPLTTLGNRSAQNTGQVGIANDWSRIQGFLIDGANQGMGMCTGGLSIFAQENSGYIDDSLPSCGMGLILMNPVDAGPYKNLNVGYSSDKNCTVPTIPLEVDGIGTEIDRVTINGNNCNHNKYTLGEVHITNYPLGTTGFSGALHIHQLHFEGSGDGTFNGSSCTTCTTDGILIDSSNLASPAQPNTGPVALSEIIGAPSAFPVTNMVHVASNFSGTLNYTNSTANSGSVNLFQDDINGNTFTRANNLTGLGFVFMDGSNDTKGSIFTNINSADMNKGIDVYDGTLGFYTGGNANATITTAGAITGLTYSTTNNCAAVGTAANPSLVACGASSAGMFSCATNASGTTCKVSTTAVTANSEIFVTEVADANPGTGHDLGVTCNTSPTSIPTIWLTARVNGTSFTISMPTITTNPACFHYHIVN